MQKSTFFHTEFHTNFNRNAEYGIVTIQSLPNFAQLFWALKGIEKALF